MHQPGLSVNKGRDSIGRIGLNQNKLMNKNASMLDNNVAQSAENPF